MITSELIRHALEMVLRSHPHKRMLRLAKALALAVISAVLICIQLLPRFELFGTYYYGWPFVHVVRHVDVVGSEPPDIYYVAFVPGVLFDLLAWTVLMLGVQMAFKPPRSGGRPWAGQIHINTMLWLLTAVAVPLALYRADPRDFWVLNRILRLEPRWMLCLLLFSIGCVVYVAGRGLAYWSWEALAPHVSRIAAKLRR
jgi:hypothetical protein